MVSETPEMIFLIRSHPSYSNSVLASSFSEESYSRTSSGGHGVFAVAYDHSVSYSGKTGPVNKVDSRVENRPGRMRIHEKEETDIAVGV